jgi:CAAX prenyl protease-like protein
MGNLFTPAALARIIPFVLFMVLLALRGSWPESWTFIDARWLYAVAVVVVSASLIWFWRQYSELGRGSGLSLKNVLLSVGVGLVVYQIWIMTTEPWMMLGEATASFVPVDENGELIWSLVIFRWVGAALMVPIMEELFWRSYLMRWIDKPEFEQVDPGSVTLKAIVLSTVVFTLAHTQWLGAVIAGLAYAWLYRHTRSLWAPVIAHVVTNGVLGVWVVLNGNWSFW